MFSLARMISLCNIISLKKKVTLHLSLHFPCGGRSKLIALLLSPDFTLCQSSLFIRCLSFGFRLWIMDFPHACMALPTALWLRLLPAPDLGPDLSPGFAVYLSGYLSPTCLTLLSAFALGLLSVIDPCLVNGFPFSLSPVGGSGFGGPTV